MKHLAEIKDWKEMINEIVCGDCLEGMKLIPDKSIDLVLTDPPYGIGFDKSIKTKAGINKFGKMRTNAIYHEESWDNSIPEKRIFDNMKRISFNQIVWGGNYFIEQGLFNSSCWLVWHKKIKDNSNFADCELAWTSFRTSVRYFQLGWVGLDGVNYGKEKRLHPTQKPVELMRWILQNYSKEGDLICDPFMGSWTTARACKDLGRNFIGFELSEKYCEIGEKRLQQQNLF